MGSKLRAAAYCRVSTNKDEQLDSYEAQQEFFRSYCQKNGFDLLQIYGDEGKSGTKMKNRTQLLRLLQDAEHEKFDVILIKDPSRLARNVVDFLTSVRQMRAIGVQVMFVNYDLSSSDSSEFMLTMLSAIAQEESANTSKRIKFGKKINAEKGRVPNLVYGYDKTIGDYFNLTINEQEAKIVREIFELYTSKTLGAALIAAELNRRGLKTKRGCNFSQNGIMRILQNPIYTGVIINGKQEIADFLTGVRNNRPAESWLVQQKPELRILSDEMFRQAQLVRQDRTESFQANGTRDSASYLYSGLIRCKCCGHHFSRFARTYQNTYVRWYCANRLVDGKHVCKNRNRIPEFQLTEAIQAYLVGILENEPCITKLMTEEFERALQTGNEKQQNKTALRRELEKLQRNKDKLIELFNSDILTLAELKERTADATRRISEINEQLSGCAAGQASLADYKRDIELIFQDLRKALSGDVLDNALLKQFIEEIVVDEQGQVEIVLKQLGSLPFSSAQL